MICTDEELSRVDEILTSEYQSAMEASSYSEELKQAQRAWLANRNKCQNRQCLVSIYEARIVKLRTAGCAVSLETGKCIDDAILKLPRTADGRLMLLTHSECRTGAKQDSKEYEFIIKFKSQSEAISVQADCIEAGIYDPCEDAGGKWGDAQCAYANLEVAKRRILRAETELLRIAQQRPELRSALPEELKSSAKRWGTVQERFCGKQNSLYGGPMSQEEYESRRAAGQTNFGEAGGYCDRRITEERADTLEQYVRLLRNWDKEGSKLLLAFLRREPTFRVKTVN
jgi:uncharacterized protein YecT (DUF1311 family)